MTIEYVNAIASGAIALWATWCVLSSKVDDGIIGRAIYAAIALSGYALLARSEGIYFTTRSAETTMYVAVALSCIRHWYMATHWPATKRWLCRALKCEHCLKCGKTRHEKD